MPSVAWKLARAASRASAASRAAAAAAGSSRASAAAARSHEGSGAVKHPPSRYHLVGDPSSADKEGMPFEKKDLESEQTLCALYNRWLSYFNVARSSVEKGYRFKIFKERVRLIYEFRNAHPKDLELNHLSDVGIDELCPPKRFGRR